MRNNSLDGELVALSAGLPDLGRLLRRHSLVDPWKIAQARHWCAVQYIVFDLLYDRGRSLLREPLWRRQQALAELGQRQALPGVWQAPGVVGAGQAYYTAVVALGHEGVMAKLLSAAYRPGRRGAAWRKIKPGRAGGARRGPRGGSWPGRPTFRPRWHTGRRERELGPVVPSGTRPAGGDDDGATWGWWPRRPTFRPRWRTRRRGWELAPWYPVARGPRGGPRGANGRSRGSTGRGGAGKLTPAGLAKPRRLALRLSPAGHSAVKGSRRR